ncbi:MAG: polysaccharide pyruvyl transferase family protein [Bacillota bacterium]
MFATYLLSRPDKTLFNTTKASKKIVVALAADYGNLGDVAITFAQTKYLEKRFPSYELVDFPISQTFSGMRALKQILSQDDIITVVGGGNMGDMYDDIEYCRQFVVSNFPRNQIISFPQTIDFSETKHGEKALKKALNVYKSHEKLKLFAREINSFEKYKTLFEGIDFQMLPDIALTLNEERLGLERNGVTLCLRKDKEQQNDIETERVLAASLSGKYKVTSRDTHIDKDKMSIEERALELGKIWTDFSMSKVVITDRLHGMIFCAITNTPCVALDNSNHKVSSVYKTWLGNMPGIKLIENFNVETILQTVDELSRINTGEGIRNDFKALFNKTFDGMGE